ncbi:capsule biosynthesis protein [Actibacterium ureilyticum]|uniref:capsule biosynthesis protein n=1 Tax=Actibacterium ureilyticum TaxID=1590614 RepID=UPI000BAA9AA1|nr:capsule biosynthesis protein CapA [Actibacterium ureilyticum]
MTQTTDRRFLFLQGPHGPFFDRAGAMLRRAGARTLRVGFNRGDAAFWSDRDSYRAYTGTPEDWPGWCDALMADAGVTDLVVYGDTRPIHAAAIALARARGLTVHVFEEGYLRPYWVSYERDGANGHSRLMDLSVAQMRAALPASDHTHTAAPATWGALRQHVFYGALYHFHVLARNGPYAHFRPHRALSVRQEFRLHLRRLLWMPARRVGRFVATRRIRRGGYPYHLVLLQLAHDTSFLDHSPFGDMSEFIDLCISAFARGAPAHHHLVFKSHPLEDDRFPLSRAIRHAARRHGIATRVHLVSGGKLARLLDEAQSAVTVNSTAGQQVLWRGLPLKAFGRAVYDKPEFVSAQPLEAFFADPQPPDRQAYVDYRRFLVETSQVPGSFYSRRGRQQLLRRIADLMLAARDPYDAVLNPDAAQRQQSVRLRIAPDR